ncbi:hypothetical protein KI387_025728, partial [Taxus chinensis]
SYVDVGIVIVVDVVDVEVGIDVHACGEDVKVGDVVVVGKGIDVIGMVMIVDVDGDAD